MTAYAGRLVRVVDGDTQRLLLEQTETHRFLDQEHTHTDRVSDQSVRLLSTWCPEESKPGGKEATAYSEDWYAVHDHQNVSLPLSVESLPKFDSFGRLLAIVRCVICNACLNEDLITNGHATVNKTALHVETLRALAKLPGNGQRAKRLLQRSQ